MTMRKISQQMCSRCNAVVVVTVGITALAFVYTFAHGLPLASRCRGPSSRRRLPLPSISDEDSSRFASLPLSAVDAAGPNKQEGPNVSNLPQDGRFGDNRILVERVVMAPPHDVRAAWKAQMPLIVDADASPPATDYKYPSSTTLLWSRVRVLDESERHVHCQIDRFGLLLQWLENVSDLEPMPRSSPVVDSTVRFLPIGGSGDEVNSPAYDSSSDATACRLVWCLELKTRYPQLAKPVARWRMSALVDAVEGMLSEPRLFTRRMRLRTKLSSSQGAQEAMEAWLDFVWRQGGGLPIPLPPFILQPRTKDSTGMDDLNSKRLIRRAIIPPGLVESIVSVDDEKHQVCYQVENPGLFTYPVYTHRGRVRFVNETTADGEAVVVMEWKVEIRPYAGFRAAVEAFTEAVINTLSRNLAAHLLEPDVVVRVSPPRGKGKQFASVRKDSWLGGVLHSHLSDHRSTAQQTISMFLPWTWGRAMDDPADAASSVWSNGNLLDSH